MTARPKHPHSIPTVYRGTQFRSRFEADVAKSFDDFGVAWEYEPKSFLLESGAHYMPDFFLRELRWWVECRGYVSDVGEQQIRGFAEQLLAGESFIVLRADGAYEMHCPDASAAWIAGLEGGSAAAFDRAFVGAVAAITTCNQRRHPGHPGWTVRNA